MAAARRRVARSTTDDVPRRAPRQEPAAPAWTRCAILPDPGARPCRDLPGGVLQVNAHRDVLDADGARRDARARRRTSAAAPPRATSSCTSTTSSPTTTLVGLPRLASTSRSCPTASAPTPAGSRPAATSAPPWSPRPAATSPSRARCSSYVHDETALRRRLARPPRCGRPTTTRPPLGARPSTERRRQRRRGRRGARARCTGRCSVSGATLRICLIASSRFPIRRALRRRARGASPTRWPRELVRRGHEVSLFAGTRAPTRRSRSTELPVAVHSVQRRGTLVTSARRRTSWMRRAPRLPRAHARARPDRRRGASTSSTTTASTTCRSRWRAMLERPGGHHPAHPADPVAGVRDRDSPPGAGRFAAVSGYTARAWAHAVADARVDPQRRGHRRAGAPGPGGGPAVWSGRLVPEKAPHVAIDAARAGRRARSCWPARSRTAAYFDARGRAAARARTSRTSGTSTSRELAALRRRRRRSPS